VPLQLFLIALAMWVLLLVTVLLRKLVAALLLPLEVATVSQREEAPVQLILTELEVRATVVVSLLLELVMRLLTTGMTLVLLLLAVTLLVVVTLLLHVPLQRLLTAALATWVFLLLAVTLLAML
jgi:hypothetical protein